MIQLIAGFKAFHSAISKTIIGDLTRETPSVGSCSKASEEFLSVLISAVITPLING